MSMRHGSNSTAIHNGGRDDDATDALPCSGSGEGRVRHLAAIDLGTVTARLLLADICDGMLTEVQRQVIITHIGDGLSQSGVISAAAIRREVEACSSFLDSIQDLEQRRGEPIAVVAVATSAMRDAGNSDAVLAALRDIGLEVQVISGDRESRLSFLGTVSGFKLPASPILCLDIGGGSTELVLGMVDFCREGGSGHRREGQENANDGAAGCLEHSIGSAGISRRTAILKAQSFNIGSRRVTDLFLASDPPTAAELAAAAEWVESETAVFFSTLEPRPQLAIAVAGTATTALTVRDGISDYHPSKVHGKAVSLGELKKVLYKLANMGLEERRRCIGLEPKRAEVIVGGLLVLEAALRLTGLDSFTVSETDIMHGMLLDFAEPAL